MEKQLTKYHSLKNCVTKHTYNTDRYPFRRLFCEMIRLWDIENMHRFGGFEDVGNEPGKDNNSSFHTLFYGKMRPSSFIACYRQFICVVIRQLIGEPIIYQKYPTLRIHIPNGKGVAAYHIDSDYNHPVDEFNIWIPFTFAKDTRSIWIESAPGKKDYNPQQVFYGQFLTFEGGKLSHGNEVNMTDETRVSIDFRIIPRSLWKPSDMKGLAYGKIRDVNGDDSYYAQMD